MSENDLTRVQKCQKMSRESVQMSENFSGTKMSENIRLVKTRIFVSKSEKPELKMTANTFLIFL